MEKTLQMLRERNRIAILPHVKPDGDALGSAFALAEILEQTGKEARVLLDAPLTPRYAAMAEGLKTGIEEGFSPDLVVAVDGASLQMLGQRPEALQKVDLCIDHHLSNEKYASYTYLDVSAAATGEIVYRIARALGATVTKTMARNLYIAISTDTGCFRYSNTTPETLRIGADLLEIFGSFSEVNQILFEKVSKNRLEIEKRILETMEYHDGDRIAVIHITHAMREETGAGEDDIENFAQLPRQVQGVEIGITVKEDMPPALSWRVSLRTNGFIDASRLAALFGGGGHVRAAGCTMEGTLPQVKARLVEAGRKALEAWENDGRSH